MISGSCKPPSQAVDPHKILTFCIFLAISKLTLHSALQHAIKNIFSSLPVLLHTFNTLAS